MNQEINELNERKEKEYAKLEEFALTLNYFEQPSFLHGALVGILVVNPLNFELANQFICEITDNEALTEKQLDFLQELHTQNLAAMQDLDIDFLPLVAPEMNLAVDRINSIAAWCAGFLRGIDKAKVNLSLASKDLQTFLATILELSEQKHTNSSMPHTEKNIEDLAMLEDFLKIGTLYAYTDWVMGVKSQVNTD